MVNINLQFIKFHHVIYFVIQYFLEFYTNYILLIYNLLILGYLVIFINDIIIIKVLKVQDYFRSLLLKRKFHHHNRFKFFLVTHKRVVWHLLHCNGYNQQNLYYNNLYQNLKNNFFLKNFHYCNLMVAINFY